MDVLSLSATVFGIVALAGGAAGYFKASRGDSIIKYQATEIDLRDGKIGNLEKDLASIRQQLDAKNEIAKRQDDHIKNLQRMAQGAPQLKRLTTAIENQTVIIGNQSTLINKLLELEEGRHERSPI